MSDILGLGTSGLKAAQSLISTTGHNVANSAKEGYSRQTTELLTRRAQFIGSTLVGSGVSVGATKRIVDDVLENVHRTNISGLNQYETRSEFSDQINTLLSNPDTGISNAINNFFNAMQQLAAETPSVQHRQVVLSQSEALVQRIHTLDERLSGQMDDLNIQIGDVVAQINSLSASYTKVNQDILTSSNLGSFTVPNDLRDERGRILNELGKLVNVFTVEDKNTGSSDIFIGTGQTLVVGGQRTILDTARNPDDPIKYDVRALSSSGAQIITQNMTGGKISGLQDYAKDFLEPARAQLGRIAISMAKTINAQHKLGIDANGDLGINYFNDYDAITLQLLRSIPNSSNMGSGTFAVSIDEIPRPNSGPFKIIGDASNIVNSGTLSTLGALELSINGTNIRATAVGDDTLSTTDNAGSAIAFANAINDSFALTGVTAKAEINSLHLGTYTAGAMIAGNFTINGSSIIPAAATADELIIAINALSETTGVKASNTNGAITLFSDDGRNIRLETNGTGVGTFQYFNTTAGALDQVQRAAVSLTHIDSAIVIAGNAPGDAGLTAGSTPPTSTSLTDSDYSLTYNGTNYILTRLSDNKVITTTASTTMTGDGMTINLNSGSVLANDTFIIRPTVGAANSFALNINLPQKLAMASPITTNSDINNKGTGKINPGLVLNTSGLPSTTVDKLGNAFSNSQKLTPPIRVEFFADINGEPNIYRVFDISNGVPGVQIGPDQTFKANPEEPTQIFPISSVVDFTTPGPNPTYVYDPGYRISIEGAPAVGDSFTIDYTKNGLGNDGNVKEFLKMQQEKLMSDNTANYVGSYTELVSRVASLTQTTEINFTAANSLHRESEARVQSISGVNLDEEAANLIRFQQAYRASAQVITIASGLFDALLNAIRG